MEFKNLRNAIIKETQERYNKILNDLNTEEGLNEKMSSYGKSYKKNPKVKFIKYLYNKFNKETQEKLNKIKDIEESDDFKNPLIITIEWKKSQMWRSNPKAYTNYGFVGSSIGGCGYDKKSTAMAEALNSFYPILKLLYARKNEELRNLKKEYTEQNGFKGTSQGHINAEVFGYGSGYQILPHFEGGVGISCHQIIIERLGLKFEYITNTLNTDVYMITKI